MKFDVAPPPAATSRCHSWKFRDSPAITDTNPDGDGVRADMVTGNDMLYVYGNDGGLRAYRVESR